MSNKKVSHIRGGKKVMQKQADAVDLVNDIRGTAKEDFAKPVDDIEQRVGIWSKTDDGRIVITYPDGHQEFLKD